MSFAHQSSHLLCSRIISAWVRRISNAYNCQDNPQWSRTPRLGGVDTLIGSLLIESTSLMIPSVRFKVIYDHGR